MNLQKLRLFHEGQPLKAAHDAVLSVYNTGEYLDTSKTYHHHDYDQDYDGNVMIWLLESELDDLYLNTDFYPADLNYFNRWDAGLCTCGSGFAYYELQLN